MDSTFTKVYNTFNKNDKNNGIGRKIKKYLDAAKVIAKQCSIAVWRDLGEIDEQTPLDFGLTEEQASLVSGGLATGDRLATDLAPDPAPVSDGRMAVPDGPGLGVTEVQAGE